MIRFAIALLLALLTISSASAQTPVRVMTGYAATSENEISRDLIL